MSAQLFSRTSRESAHLALLGALAVLVPAIWLLLLHWSPGKLIDQGDNLASGYIYLKQLMEADGQWQQLLFWPQPLGGVKAHDVAGSLPVVQLMIKLGAGFITISNVSILSLQVMFGYFCARAVAGLSLQGFQQRTLPLATLIAIGVMFAFLPALGWRVTEGHQTIIQGLFVFVCMAVLIVDESNDQRSALTVLLSLIVLSHTFQYNGFQTMYYSVVLGAPMILAILMVPPDQTLRQRALLTLFPVAVFGCAILFSVPKLWGVIGNAFSDDSGRVYGSSVIYSYTTATAADWITSLPWSPDLIPEDRLPYKFEVNYPMGTFLLLLALAGINRTTLSLAAGILVSLFMALVISTNFQPFSTLLVSSLPMMESFRVPARAMLPVLVFLSIVAITVLVNLDRRADASRWSLKAILSFILIALVTSQLPTLIVDLVLLLALAGLVFARASVAKRPDIVRYLFAFIVGAAVGAFETRIHPPLEHPLAGIAETRQELLGQAPDLEKPLVRAHTLISLPHVGPNTMFSMGI
ncbi:MAG: hypothetical protein O3B72_08375, partial [Proteobacteria bacterium]|nr:hypothetical protein [Pseudomonadota bacterium]